MQDSRDTGLGLDALESAASLLERAVARKPLAAQLSDLVLFIERLSQNMRCSILLANVEAGTLHLGAAPNLPAAYSAAIDGAAYGEGIGSCGTAAARRATVVVCDIQTSPLWRDFRELAKIHGLAACWSTPIIGGSGELLGTFAMYYGRPQEPTDADIRALRIAGPLAAMVIQQHCDLHRLRESEERFRSAFDFAAIGKALVSCEGHWSRVNDALCRIVGYSKDELLKTDFQSITHPDDLAADMAFVHAMLEGSLSYYEMEKRYIHRSGKTIWVYLSVSIVRDEYQRPLYFISQMQDITERKRLEEALRAATSGEHKRLGRDLHDGLGQDLTGLALLADAFATEAARQCPALAADALTLAKIARDGVTTCRNIVRGISPLTESQGGLINSIRHLVARTGSTSRQHIHFAASESVPVRLPWDSLNELYRITQEALNNAIAHSGASRIDVHIASEMKYVRIEIKDDGRGFAPALRESAGVGIQTMRYRAAVLGARLDIKDRASGGASVICECPQLSASLPISV